MGSCAWKPKQSNSVSKSQMGHLREASRSLYIDSMLQDDQCHMVSQDLCMHVRFSWPLSRRSNKAYHSTCQNTRISVVTQSLTKPE
jgi:hypothetical protein